MQSPVEQHPSSPYLADDEIDLLELLAVVAENIKLLILTPLAVGLLAWGATFWMTPIYESVSILNPGILNKSTPHVIAGLAKSADVLSKVGKDLGITVNALTANLKVSVGLKDNLVTLTTRAATPRQAQQINEAILKNVYPLTQPAPADRVRMEEQIGKLQSNLSLGEALAQSLAIQIRPGQLTDTKEKIYSTVFTANNRCISEIARLQELLDGLSDAKLIQRPTLPGAPVKPKKAQTAIVAALITGVLVFFFVLIRQTFRDAKNNPQQIDKLRRLRKALGMLKDE